MLAETVPGAACEVTRVGVQSSELPEKGSGDSDSGSGGGSDSSSDECRTHKFIAKFAIVVAFDAAPVAESASGEAPPVATTEPTETSESEGSEEEG